MSNAWARYFASGMAAAVGAAVFETSLPMYWLAGLTLVVVVDFAAYQKLLKRLTAGDPCDRIPLLIMWAALQGLYGNALAAILWFSPIGPGKAMAVIFVCGGLANAAATFRHSPALSAASVSAAAFYLLGLPVVEFASEHGRNPLDLSLIVGGLLLLAWGVKLWKSLVASDEALVLAEAAAVRERQAAAAAAAAKSDMIRRMNDELRTPLAALTGAAEHLRRAAATPSAREHIGTLIHASEVLKLVLDDLSDLDRLENGRLPINLQKADARLLARGVVAAFRTAAQDKQIELFLDIAPETPACVLIDPVRVRQVLFNLIANAVRYTTYGGVRVRVSASPADGEKRARLIFSVADTGAGMSRAQLASVLGRSRVGGEGDGPGLGLAISVKLARLMGGEITARSEPGQGSLFTFAIAAPVVAMEQNPRSAA